MGFQQNTIIEQPKRRMVEYSTEELRDIIGGFKKEYQKNCKGKRVHNDILGYTYEGVVKFAGEYGAIVFSERIWKVKLPQYRRYELARRAMTELQCRREYAQKMDAREVEQINKK